MVSHAFPMTGVTLYKAFMNPARSKYHIRNTTKTLRSLCGCEISPVNLSHTVMAYRDDRDDDVCKRCFEKWWHEWEQGASVKLSIPQKNTLSYAVFKIQRDRFGEAYQRMEDGWFMPQFTRRGSIEHFCRPQTAKSLHTLGFLETRTVGGVYWNPRVRQWQYDIEYRITPMGIEIAAGLE